MAPVLGASAVIVQGGRVLLILRASGAFVGCWSLPGGTVEDGEALAETARREVREETGLDVRVGERVWIHEQLADPGHYVIVVFRAELLGGDLHAGDDAEDARWFDPAEVAGLETTPGLLDALRAADLDV